MSERLRCSDYRFIGRQIFPAAEQRARRGYVV